MDAEPVVIGTLMTEGGGWRAALGEDAGLVRTLGAMPLFHPDGAGGLSRTGADRAPQRGRRSAGPGQRRAGVASVLEAQS